MFYPKNVPNIERALRIIGGIVLMAIALFGQPLVGDITPLGGGMLIFSALFMVVTGFIGWCPACAIVGRKNKTSQPHESAH